MPMPSPLTFAAGVGIGMTASGYELENASLGTQLPMEVAQASTAVERAAGFSEATLVLQNVHLRIEAGQLKQALELIPTVEQVRDRPLSLDVLPMLGFTIGSSFDFFIKQRHSPFCPWSWTQMTPILLTMLRTTLRGCSSTI